MTVVLSHELFPSLLKLFELLIAGDTANRLSSLNELLLKRLLIAKKHQH